MTPHLVLAHLGSLHPYEGAVLGLVAFGPFIVLAVVVGRRRRRVDEDGPGPS